MITRIKSQPPRSKSSPGCSVFRESFESGSESSPLQRSPAAGRAWRRAPAAAGPARTMAWRRPQRREVGGGGLGGGAVRVVQTPLSVFNS
jgi:hypothetical protein